MVQWVFSNVSSKRQQLYMHFPLSNLKIQRIKCYTSYSYLQTRGLFHTSSVLNTTYCTRGNTSSEKTSLGNSVLVEMISQLSSYNNLHLLVFNVMTFTLLKQQCCFNYHYFFPYCQFRKKNLSFYDLYLSLAAFWVFKNYLL